MMVVLENITKKFAGVTALDRVSIELYAGEVNAIIGENGAGKSTLMKILSGIYPDYEGRILYKGNPVRFSNPKEAQEHGIAIIHQELNLIPWLNISENIFLGREITGRWGMLDKTRMHRITRSLLDRLKLPVNPDTPVYKLKVGQQQVVEIAKALLTEAEVVIMDEPTSAISEQEVEVLFGIIEELKRDGKAVVYISHKLDELFRIAGCFVVLRDGKSVTSGKMKDMSRDAIIRKMTGTRLLSGRNTLLLEKGTAARKRETLLSAEHMHLQHPRRKGKYLLNNISFTLGKGEVLGVFGMMGAGRTELLETLFGLHPRLSSGRIFIAEKERIIRSPADAIRAGMALVPEDRKKDGLVPGMDVKANISICSLRLLEELGVLSSRKEKALAGKYIRDLQIKTSSAAQLVSRLSGGNQQKIMLAKWLATQPKILLMDEPTRGVDVNAKNEIYKLILSLAGAGLGILVVSSELPEILAVSDRILVMCEGRLTAEMPAAGASEDQILAAAIPQQL